ncbi:hypothetical protein N0V94_006981 [Neodidymelliopsis sp. IMI 364377]|nr:hypothetical protein N0V94_006981 [Neodidymelliopsis sp. IMI 364377]
MQGLRPQVLRQQIKEDIRQTTKYSVEEAGRNALRKLMATQDKMTEQLRRKKGFTLARHKNRLDKYQRTLKPAVNKIYRMAHKAAKEAAKASADATSYKKSVDEYERSKITKNELREKLSLLNEAVNNLKQPPLTAASTNDELLAELQGKIDSHGPSFRDLEKIAGEVTSLEAEFKNLAKPLAKAKEVASTLSSVMTKLNEQDILLSQLKGMPTSVEALFKDVHEIAGKLDKIKEGPTENEAKQRVDSALRSQVTQIETQISELSKVPEQIKKLVSGNESLRDEMLGVAQRQDACDFRVSELYMKVDESVDRVKGIDVKVDNAISDVADLTTEHRKVKENVRDMMAQSRNDQRDIKVLCRRMRNCDEGLKTLQAVLSMPNQSSEQGLEATQALQKLEDIAGPTAIQAIPNKLSNPQPAPNFNLQADDSAIRVQETSKVEPYNPEQPLLPPNPSKPANLLTPLMAPAENSQQEIATSQIPTGTIQTPTTNAGFPQSGLSTSQFAHLPGLTAPAPVPVVSRNIFEDKKFDFPSSFSVNLASPSTPSSPFANFGADTTGIPPADPPATSLASSDPMDVSSPEYPATIPPVPAFEDPLASTSGRLPSQDDVMMDVEDPDPEGLLGDDELLVGEEREDEEMGSDRDAEGDSDDANAP